jgi:hypothetical protein
MSETKIKNYPEFLVKFFEHKILYVPFIAKLKILPRLHAYPEGLFAQCLTGRKDFLGHFYFLFWGLFAQQISVG